MSSFLANLVRRGAGLPLAEIQPPRPLPLASPAEPASESLPMPTEARRLESQPPVAEDRRTAPSTVIEHPRRERAWPPEPATPEHALVPRPAERAWPGEAPRGEAAPHPVAAAQHSGQPALVHREGEVPELQPLAAEVAFEREVLESPSQATHVHHEHRHQVQELNRELLREQWREVRLEPRDTPPPLPPPVRRAAEPAVEVDIGTIEIQLQEPAPAPAARPPERRPTAVPRPAPAGFDAYRDLRSYRRPV